MLIERFMSVISIEIWKIEIVYIFHVFIKCLTITLETIFRLSSHTAPNVLHGIILNHQRHGHHKATQNPIRTLTEVSFTDIIYIKLRHKWIILSHLIYIKLRHKWIILSRLNAHSDVVPVLICFQLELYHTGSLITHHTVATRANDRQSS